MSGRGRLAARLLIFVAGAMTFAWLLSPSGPGAPGQTEPCFRTRAEAWQYALARIAAAPNLSAAGDPYSSTFARSYKTIGGEKADFFLVADAARELELAEGFAAHGFVREALAHYDNLIAFHSDSPQAATARDRVGPLRKGTVLGLVAPLSVVMRDPQGRLFAQAGDDRPEPPPLDRIERTYLETTVPLRGPLEVIGFIDDAGSIVRWTDDERPIPVDNEPAILLKEGQMRVFREGAVAAGRAYYALSGDSLFTSERDAKVRLLGSLATPEAAEAKVYLGLVEKPVDLSADAERLAADPASPLHLDARWLLKVRDNPRFMLSTRSAVTTGAELPLEIDAHAIDSMTFSFARFEGPLPATEVELKAWLKKAGPTQSHEEKMAIEPGQKTRYLPVREVGSYRVTAEARGISCDFIVVRTDLSLEVFALPGENFITASRSGITIAAAQKPIGTTDEEGCVVPTGKLFGQFCDAHKECCSGCASCHHHHDDRSFTANPAVFVTGRGQFFRASARLESEEVAKVKVPPSGPLLFVHTDRPAYKAGDSLKFRGILRVPKSPLLRKDPSRLLAGAGREVAVAVKCGDTTIFSRTYVTGDQGTFHGEFPLPLTAFRAEYALIVTCEGASISRPFDVLDYRKSDYSIVLTTEKTGVRVRAGYVWGADVPGATLQCKVGGRDATPTGDLLAAADRETVEVILMRGEEELARKRIVFRAPSGDDLPVVAKPIAPPPAEGAPVIVTAPMLVEEEPKTPLFTVKTDKTLYRRGESIEVVVEGPWDEGEATVLLADLQVYDRVRVPIRNGRGAVKIPARAIHDPGVAVFALCNGYQTKLEVQVRANQMQVSVEVPPKGRPGEKVDVTLRGDALAAFSVAAVDEAIYMIREDDAPELYTFFHPERPSALAHATFENFEFDGEKHLVEKLPSDPSFRTGVEIGGRLFRGKAGVYETIGLGVGGGGGGRYGGRFGGKANLVARGGGVRATESSVLNSLRAICSTQRPDGSWPGGTVTEAGTLSDVGMTGLSLLAFLGAGYSQLSKDEYPDPANPGQTFKMGEMVKKALQWLLSRQDAGGRFGRPEGDSILNHAIATLALSEAYGMTASNPLQGPAKSAVAYLNSRQSLNGGWHRADSDINGEILASTFAVMALKSAQLSELSYPEPVLVNALRFFTESTDSDGLRGENPSRAEVAGAALSRIFIRRDRNDSRVIGAAAWLVTPPPAWSQQDFLGWYLTSLALFQVDGPDGPCWKAWHEPMKRALIPNQAKSGSWSVGKETVFPTAMGSLIFQVYYRYANVFGAGGGKDRYEVPLLGAPRVRLHFPDTVFWAPELMTDWKGEARISFKLPDQITTTRVTARGITKEAAAGQAVGRIRSQQPFFLKIRAPEFAVVGDEFDVSVDLYNYTGSGLQTTVKLEGAAEIRKPHVPADRPASVSWRVRATDPAGLRLVVHAESGRHQDSMERTIPVHRLEGEAFSTTRGKSGTGGAYGFEAQKGALDLVVKIRPQKGSLSQVLDALRYLNQYPYG